MKRKSSRFSTYDSNGLVIPGRSGRLRIFIWGLLATVLFAALFAIKPTLLQPLDYLNQDLLLRHFPRNHAGNRLVIVDLDEKSLNQYGQWPWPRYQVARLFDKISAMKPAAIGIDMIFAEPDRTSAGRLLKDLGDTYRIDLSIDRLPGTLSDNDRILAEALARGPFVLAHQFHFNPFAKSSEQCILHPVKISFMQRTGAHEERAMLPQSSGVLCNLPILSDQSDSSGFINFSPDKDGMLRRLPLLIEYEGEIYPSLALATVLKSRNAGHLLLKKHGQALQSVSYQETTVPVDPHGHLLIKYRGPKRSYDYVSAADIMDGGVSPDRLQGRIAFVGTSASGLKELHTSPFDPIFPGVEVHATVADNLLQGDFISVPGWSSGVILSLVLVLGVLLSLLVAFRNALTCFFVMLICIVGLWLGTQQAFYHQGVFVGTAFPIASVAGAYVFLTVLKYRLEEKKTISRMRELLLTQDITIESMANLAEYRDYETGGHIKRTRRYVKLLAEHLKTHHKYKHFLTDANIDMLYKSVPLHDIGKVGIPDNILLNPGPLDEKEFETMKTHTIMGRDVIESSARKLGKKSFLSIAAEIAYTHQEKWDGSGYPLGLKGEAIPVSGRLMALADVYDALISKRIYKPPFPHDVSVEIIRQSRGTHFDPDMVDAFLEIHEQFREIAREFSDFTEERETLEQETPAENLMQESQSKRIEPD